MLRASHERSRTTAFIACSYPVSRVRFQQRMWALSFSTKAQTGLNGRSADQTRRNDTGWAEGASRMSSKARWSASESSFNASLHEESSERCPRFRDTSRLELAFAPQTASVEIFQSKPGFLARATEPDRGRAPRKLDGSRADLAADLDRAALVSKSVPHNGQVGLGARGNVLADRGNRICNLAG